MGRRGPPPTPKAILESRGSWRAEERQEVEMPSGLPECPDWLCPVAREQWFRLMPLLTEARVLRQTDGPALARYCETYAKWREATDFLSKWGSYQTKYKQARDEDGALKFEEDGETKIMVVSDTEIWPQASLAVKLADALTRMEDRFGLNPSARTGVHSDPKETPADSKSRFFG